MVGLSEQQDADDISYHKDELSIKWLAGLKGAAPENLKERNIFTYREKKRHFQAFPDIPPDNGGPQTHIRKFRLSLHHVSAGLLMRNT